MFPVLGYTINRFRWFLLRSRTSGFAAWQKPLFRGVFYRPSNQRRPKIRLPSPPVHYRVTYNKCCCTVVSDPSCTRLSFRKSRRVTQRKRIINDLLNRNNIDDITDRVCPWILKVFTREIMTGPLLVTPPQKKYVTGSKPAEADKADTSGWYVNIPTSTVIVKVN